VLAGPVLTHTLAEYGADVLSVTTSSLPQMEPVRLYTGWGKRSTTVSNLADVSTLIDSCDVVVQGMRPGSLARHGLPMSKLFAVCYFPLCVHGENKKV